MDSANLPCALPKGRFSDASTKIGAHTEPCLSLEEKVIEVTQLLPKSTTTIRFRWHEQETAYPGGFAFLHPYSAESISSSNYICAAEEKPVST